MVNLALCQADFLLMLHAVMSKAAEGKAPQKSC
jgi:hypothetical protein